MPGPKPVQIKTTARERQALEYIERRQTASQQLVRRARIVLEAGAGVANAAIARKLDVKRDTVMTWRSRYAEAQPHLREEFNLREEFHLCDAFEEASSA